VGGLITLGELQAPGRSNCCIAGAGIRGFLLSISLSNLGVFIGVGGGTKSLCLALGGLIAPSMLVFGPLLHTILGTFGNFLKTGLFAFSCKKGKFASAREMNRGSRCAGNAEVLENIRRHNNKCIYTNHYIEKYV
jgi:hypothetical protein